MRPLKFRAWDVKNKLMGVPFEVIGLLSEWFFTHEHVLMQYTGVDDKNGKEIYEGDIVIFGHPPVDWVCEVCWSKLHAWFFLAPWGDKRVDGNNHFNFYRDRPDYYEVIGNIYEGKKLLRKPRGRI